MATPSASGTAMISAMSEVAIVPKMKGSAPKSPETGSHASRVKKLQPNCARLRWERRIRILRMKRTIAKMLNAQSSMTAAKLVSAMRPLPRLFRKSRIGEGIAATADDAASGARVAGGPSSVGGTGGDDLESRSSVMRVVDTIYFG